MASERWRPADRAITSLTLTTMLLHCYQTDTASSKCCDVQLTTNFRLTTNHQRARLNSDSKYRRYY